MDKIIYNSTMVLHIIGIVLMAGATFIDFSGFRRFWKVLLTDRGRALMQEEELYKLQRIMGIGMLLILLSGVGMMAYLHQVWGQQIWFRIKMGILLLIIINGLAIRRRLGNKLRKGLQAGESTEALLTLKSKITLMHGAQLLFFVIIFILSIFKFN